MERDTNSRSEGGSTNQPGIEDMELSGGRGG